MKTSYRTMLVNKYPSSYWYQISCGCGDKDHTMTIVLEKDKDVLWNDTRVLWFYKNIQWTDQEYGSFLSRWKHRIKAACKVLFQGHLEAEGDFLIQGKEHIDSFIQTLQEAQAEMEDHKED